MLQEHNKRCHEHLRFRAEQKKMLRCSLDARTKRQERDITVIQQYYLGLLYR